MYRRYFTSLIISATVKASKEHPGIYAGDRAMNGYVENKVLLLQVRL
jgi:hypothetical protein